MTVIDWLLDSSDPSVRYRTLVELLDRGDTPEAREAQRLIPDSAPVKKLLTGRLMILSVSMKMKSAAVKFPKTKRNGLFAGSKRCGGTASPRVPVK